MSIRLRLIIPVVLALSAGCASTPAPSSLESAQQAAVEWRTKVRAVISDQERAEKVIGHIDQLEKLVVDADQERKDHDDILRALNANYDATEAEFRAAFDTFNAKKNVRQHEALAINRQIRTLTSPEEWKALSKVMVTTLDAALKVGRGTQE